MVASWISPKAVKGKESVIEGLGLFAVAPISSGEMVAVKGGHIVATEELKKLSERLQSTEIQIAGGLHLAALTEDEYEPVKLFINHSCEPNVGFGGNTVLVAMRDIDEGEELTTDYALFSDADGGMDCACGRPSCRKRVDWRDWRRPELQEKYRGYFSWYLERRIHAQTGREPANHVRQGRPAIRAATSRGTDHPSPAGGVESTVSGYKHVSRAPTSVTRTKPSLPIDNAKGGAMPGRVVHLEIPADNTQSARDFWGGLFGWQFESYPGPAEYHMTQISDQTGGAITNMEPGKRGARVYFDVDDINNSASRVKQLGGDAGQPSPVPSMGWFAICQDTEGNEFGLWQNDPSAPAPPG